MQVNNNLNTSNTVFGARLRVKPEHIDHVMNTIDNRCDMKGLKRIYNALKVCETGIGKDEVVFIEPVLQRGKRKLDPEYGFIKAKIGERIYTNDVVPTFSFWSLPHFFKKIQRLTKEKFMDTTTRLTARTDEIAEQNDRMINRILGIEKFGSRKPCPERDNLLDGILSILTKKA